MAGIALPVRKESGVVGMTQLFVIHLLATFFMFGLIWFIQIVHYPLFAAVGKQTFVSYEKAHMSRTSRVVIPAMLTELGTGLFLLWQRPEFFPALSAWLGIILLAVIWLSTAALQIPQHNMLAQNFNSQGHANLVASNWLRTIAWSGRTILLTYTRNTAL